MFKSGRGLLISGILIISGLLMSTSTAVAGSRPATGAPAACSRGSNSAITHAEWQRQEPTRTPEEWIAAERTKYMCAVGGGTASVASVAGAVTGAVVSGPVGWAVGLGVVGLGVLTWAGGYT